MAARAALLSAPAWHCAKSAQGQELVGGTGASQVPHREHKGTTSPLLAGHPGKLLLSPRARQPGKTPGVRSRWFTTEKTMEWSWQRFSKGKMRKKVQK